MMQKLRNLFIPITLIALIAILVLSLSQKPTSPQVTFTTLAGEKISMTSLKGKVVLVNFWATDCPGCIKEMPDLINTYNQYKPLGFEVVAVAMPYDPPAQVLNYTQLKSLPFPVMHDGLSEMVQAFGGVNLTPTTFLYDKEGKRLQRIIGELNFSQLRQLLDKELR
jgi:thiol-disulfide isomerase/thioredoxin